MPKLIKLNDEEYMIHTQAIDILWHNEFDLDKFKNLLRLSPNIIYDGKNHQSLLMTAIRSAEKEAIQTIVDYGIDLNASPIHSYLFEAKYQPQMFKFFLEKGARLKEGEKEELENTHPSLTKLYTTYIEKDKLEATIANTSSTKKIKL